LSKSPNYPDVNEVVVGVVKRLETYAAILELDGYDGVGFLHISELPGRHIKSVPDRLKLGQRLALLVVSVNKAAGRVSLSLRRMSREEGKAKLREVKESEGARQIILDAAKNLGADPNALLATVEGRCERRYGSLGEAITRMVESDETVLTRLGVPREQALAIYEVARTRIRKGTEAVAGVMEVSFTAPNGVDLVKEVFTKEMASAARRQIEASVFSIGAPRYQVEVRAKTAKAADRALQDMAERMREAVEKQGGIFSFQRT